MIFVRFSLTVILSFGYISFNRDSQIVNIKSFEFNFYLPMLEQKTQQFAKFFIKDIKKKSSKSKDNRYVYNDIIFSSPN